MAKSESRKRSRSRATLRSRSRSAKNKKMNAFDNASENVIFDQGLQTKTETFTPLNFENHREETFDIIYSDGSKTVIVSLTTNSELLILLLRELSNEKLKGGAGTNPTIESEYLGNNYYSIYEYLRTQINENSVGGTLLPLLNEEYGLHDNTRSVKPKLIFKLHRETNEHIIPNNKKEDRQASIVSLQRTRKAKHNGRIKIVAEEVVHVTFWEFRENDHKGCRPFHLNAGPSDNGHAHIRNEQIRNRNIYDNIFNHANSVIGFTWFINFDGEKFFLSFNELDTGSNATLINDRYVNPFINALKKFVKSIFIPCHILKINHIGFTLLKKYLTSQKKKASDMENLLNECGLRIDQFPLSLR